MKKHYIILTLAILSFIAALFDINAGIYVAVLANVLANVIVLSRQKAKIVTVKKKRAMTVDEFRQKEMEANPHRHYPQYGASDHDFTD